MIAEHAPDIRELKALRGILPLNLLFNTAARALYLVNRHRLPGTPEIREEDLF